MTDGAFLSLMSAVHALAGQSENIGTHFKNAPFIRTSLPLLDATRWQRSESKRTCPLAHLNTVSFKKSSETCQ